MWYRSCDCAYLNTSESSTPFFILTVQVQPSVMSTNDEILSPNITESDLPSKEQVVKLCRKNGINANHLTHTHNDRKFFIKYNNVKMAEARNQHPSRGFDVSIRIPEIYHAFTSRYRTYIVMEHIDIDHLASNAQRAKAITELVSIESPENSTPGPIGGRYIRHRFFKDFTSTIAYKSVRELERHVNRVCMHCNRITLAFYSSNTHMSSNSGPPTHPST